ncbi:hypothetical protein PLEOSDRAFT_169479 [Pleurotus ostreatus PC15]|uniref:Uncharacterized protein n=1 Tax=Pleurotus ostreatus (strain PC15) TaxID=1137138 RepID=A0A067NPA2_PLEO1|nr:hypothetical protein PLEOSDRAFT_169479 [Pleurotus ostreatus PC15]
MGRGRPRIYHTEEEKIAANRAKSKRSYDKLGRRTRQEVSPAQSPPATSRLPGRPKVYHTEEERMEANRAKSRHSYRRHKLSIGAKKVVQYRAETRGRNRLIPGASRRRGPLGLDPETIPEWLALVQQVSDKFQAVTKPSTRAYVERLYQRYAISRRKDVLSDTVLEFTGLQKTIQRCEAGLLQLGIPTTKLTQPAPALTIDMDEGPSVVSCSLEVGAGLRLIGTTTCSPVRHTVNEVFKFILPNETDIPYAMEYTNLAANSDGVPALGGCGRPWCIRCIHTQDLKHKGCAAVGTTDMVNGLKPLDLCLHQSCRRCPQLGQAKRVQRRYLLEQQEWERRRVQQQQQWGLQEWALVPPEQRAEGAETNCAVQAGRLNLRGREG